MGGVADGGAIIGPRNEDAASESSGMIAASDKSGCAGGDVVDGDVNGC